MSQLSTSSAVTERDRPTQSSVHSGRRTRIETHHAEGVHLSYSCTQQRVFVPDADGAPGLCSSSSRGGCRPHTRHPASDEELEAATPTRSTRITGSASSPDSPGRTRGHVCSKRTSDGEAAGTVSVARHYEATQPLASSPPPRPSCSVPTSGHAADDTQSEQEGERLASHDCAPWAQPRLDGKTAATIDLQHPIVHFLSSAQLQGFSEHLLGVHGLHNMEDLLAVARSEDEAGALLGTGASRQHKLDFWKGLQRWLRDTARDEKRQAKEALKLQRAAATRHGRRRRTEDAHKVSLSAVPVGRPSTFLTACRLSTTGHADTTGDVFSIDRLCDELLSSTQERYAHCPVQACSPQRSHDAPEDEEDGSDCSTRVASASQLMRALTLSGDDIAALRARRHLRESPSPHGQLPAARSPRTEPVIVDVDAEDSADEDEASEKEAVVLAAQPERSSSADSADRDQAGVVADTLPRASAALSVSQRASDVLSSLAGEMCLADVAGLARPASDVAVGTPQPVPALHCPHEAVNLCGLYRRTASLALPEVASSHTEHGLAEPVAMPSAQLRTRTPSSSEMGDDVCAPAAGVDDRVQPVAAVLLSTEPSLEQEVQTLRDALEAAVTKLVDTYNTSVARVTQRYPGTHTPSLFSLQAVLTPMDKSTEMTLEASALARRADAAPMLFSRLSHPQEAHLSPNAPGKSPPTTRRALWSVQTNDQRGCHGASQDELIEPVTPCSTPHAEEDGMQDEAIMSQNRDDADRHAAAQPPRQGECSVRTSHTSRFVPSLDPSEGVAAGAPAEPFLHSVFDPERTVFLSAPTRETETTHRSPPPRFPLQSPLEAPASLLPDAESPSRHSSDTFWETFGLDAITDNHLQTTLSTTHPTVTSIPIDVDEEASSTASFSDEEAMPAAGMVSGDVDPSPRSSPFVETMHIASAAHLADETQTITDTRQTDVATPHIHEDREDAVQWLLATALHDDTLLALASSALRQRCAWLGLRVPSRDVEAESVSVHSGPSNSLSVSPSPTATEATATTAELSSIPLDQFGIDSLNETAGLTTAMGQPTQLDIPSETLLAGESLSRSPSPPPPLSTTPTGREARLNDPRAAADATRAAPLSASQTSVAPRRHRKRRARDVDLCEDDELRAQLRLAAVRARFQRLVCPALLHRVPRFSGLPYHRPRYAKSTYAMTPPTSPPDGAFPSSPPPPSWAKEQDHAEMWRCVLAALAADSVEHVEAHALPSPAPAQGDGVRGFDGALRRDARVGGGAAAVPMLSTMDRLLLLEPLDCDAVTALVHRDFEHVARTRVRQLLVDSGVSINVTVPSVTSLATAPQSPSASAVIADDAEASPARTQSTAPDAGPASPEEARRANARHYFATRGMPVRGGRQGLWRGRGRGGRRRGGG